MTFNNKTKNRTGSICEDINYFRNDFKTLNEKVDDKNQAYSSRPEQSNPIYHSCFDLRLAEANRLFNPVPSSRPRSRIVKRIR